MTMRVLYFFLMACCGLAAITVLFLTYVLVYEVEPESFEWVEVDANQQITEQGAVCEPIIMEQPAVAFQSIAAFATEAMLSINSYDYLNWDQAIPDALNTYFTAPAARVYMNQFSRSGLLQTVRNSYYTVSAVTLRPAMVVSTSSVGGQRSWTVQIPILLRYQTGVTNQGGGATAHSQNQVFTVTVIEQQPTLRNYRGVAINDITNRTIRQSDELDQLR